MCGPRALLIAPHVVGIVVFLFSDVDQGRCPLLYWEFNDDHRICKGVGLYIYNSTSLPYKKELQDLTEQNIRFSLSHVGGGGLGGICFYF